MGRIYFAGESLACIRDTRGLALDHGMIWRSPVRALRNLLPGEGFLLSFWRGTLAGGAAIPLARCQTRAPSPAAGEQALPNVGPSCAVIPEGLRPVFLGATAGQGGDGYTVDNNPVFCAVCVDVVDPLDGLWAQVGAGAHAAPPALFGFNRTATGRKALWNFDPERLVHPPLPQGLWPVP